MRKLTCLDLGRAAYLPTLELQQRLVRRVWEADGREAFLVLVEHDPPVITFGVRKRPEHVLASPARLDEEGVEVHETRRGGDVTYHGPGQLVGYPIMRVDRDGRGLRGYLRDLEEVLILVLRRFGVVGRRIAGLTGVWVGDEKIGAIGVAVRRWVTYHGFALNVAADLSHFGLIVPCGIRDKPVTSLEQLLNRSISVDEVKQPVVDSMVDVFGFDGVGEACVEGGVNGDCRMQEFEAAEEFSALA